MKNTALARNQSIVLDFLRFSLAAIVVLGHGLGFFLGYFDGFFPRVFPYPQSIAVVCFFFLSGYLIAGSQLRQRQNGRDSLTGYLFDRTTRVYTTLIPALLFVVAVDSFFYLFTATQLNTIKEYATPTILAKNILLLPSKPFGTMRPVWSLMYEWWIYMMFGGFFYLQRKPIAASILAGLGAFFAIKVSGSGGAGHIWIIWVFGAWCAHLQTRFDWTAANQRIVSTAAIALLLIAFANYTSTKDAYDIFSGLTLSGSIFLFINTFHQQSATLEKFSKATKVLASFSFTLFLTHYTVLIYIKEFFRLDGWTGLIAGFFISCLVALSIAYQTELRLQEIKKFLLNRVFWNRQ